MANPNLTKELNRLRHLHGNKKKSEEELIRQAQVNLNVRAFGHEPLFDNADEQELAKKKFKAYLVTNELESMSEIDTLRSLVYNEIFETRIQKELNKLAAKDQCPPEKLTKQLTEIQNQRFNLKIKLGIDKEDDNKDELTGLQTAKKRLNLYINANKEEFSFTCSHGTLHLLRRRVKDFDSMEHPWFAGRWLFNYEILKDVKNKKLSKEDAWRYLSAASQGGKYKPSFDKKYCVDYVTYCLKNWHEITEFLNKNKG